MISGISPYSSASTDYRRSPTAPRAEAVQEAAVPSTALIPVTPAEKTAAHTYRDHTDPSFLIHLIATAEHEPQTRRLRQTSSAEGAARYAAANVAMNASPPSKPARSKIA
jgi:hypothetical protein